MRSRLREIRLMRNMTQQEVAAAAEIERVTYTNIELGNKNPSFAVAARIKKVLDYHDDDIFLDMSAPKVNTETEKTRGQFGNIAG